MVGILHSNVIFVATWVLAWETAWMAKPTLLFCIFLGKGSVYHHYLWARNLMWHNHNIFFESDWPGPGNIWLDPNSVGQTLHAFILKELNAAECKGFGLRDLSVNVNINFTCFDAFNLSTTVFVILSLRAGLDGTSFSQQWAFLELCTLATLPGPARASITAMARADRELYRSHGALSNASPSKIREATLVSRQTMEVFAARAWSLSQRATVSLVGHRTRWAHAVA